jgi:microcystin-dependent protein
MKQKQHIAWIDVPFLQGVVNFSFFFLIILLFTSFSDKQDNLVRSEIDFSSLDGPDPFVGEVAIFPYNFAPRGWAKCDGQLLPISQNEALFSLIGTIYGGDGRTTFGLPDLRGRTVIEYGQGPGLQNYTLGSKGGVENSILNVQNLAAHSHSGTIKAKNGPGDETNPKGGFLATAATDFYAEISNVDMANNSVQTNNTGNNTSFTNMQPYQTLGYYIALVGVYPSRN